MDGWKEERGGEERRRERSKKGNEVAQKQLDSVSNISTILVFLLMAFFLFSKQQ